MSLSNEQQHQLNRLSDYKQDIETSMFHIQRILKDYFPQEYEFAYQHWIPQIVTALSDHDKWLPRGQLTMQSTLDRIVDKANDSVAKGVTKYIN